MEKRKNDQTVAPTSFLWAAYLPHRYYYEVWYAPPLSLFGTLLRSPLISYSSSLASHDGYAVKKLFRETAIIVVPENTWIKYENLFGDDHHLAVSFNKNAVRYGRFGTVCFAQFFTTLYPSVFGTSRLN